MDVSLWVVLLPVLAFFVLQLSGTLSRYAGRRGGRRLSRRQALVLFVLGTAAMIWISVRVL
ncbi:hypothetical protein [Sediminicurvatus halobius]|uniref:Uncharacterized protein n=1 Tax=Sediminicurvatus halobius TaxID=2182432 RepID=A0A2U2N2F8_9GAMM|nr:hypothetical protein [Spiribacter halobius]PWG63415.1 hypothetical protein DEM34_08895 [Spiribacter halobius]UEX78085.1 hypothetical protein LMH63_00150 [Spiribacter halobius]